MSQVGGHTYDYKPELIKRAGTPFDTTGKLEFFASKPGNCVPSYWPFRQHGQSGRWISDLFPHLATCVDDMAFIYSMQSKSAVHAPAMFMMNTGFIQPGFPRWELGRFTGWAANRRTAGLRRASRLARRAAGGPGQLELGISARGLSGHESSQRARQAADRRSLSSRWSASGSKSAGARPLCRAIELTAADRPGDTELEARSWPMNLPRGSSSTAPEATEIERETAATRNCMASTTR